MRAGAAALALLLCMLLPWYRASFPQPKSDEVLHDNLTAFGAFSWVEAAILVVSGAVMYLLYTRSQGKAFHLPGGDGWAVTIAGGWSLFLLIWRLFDRPDVAQGSVGVQWGLFVTMLVAAAMLVAGQNMRLEHKPEPPNPAADDPGWETVTHAGRTRRRPVDSHAVTRTLREDRPAWEGDPPDPPSRAQPSRPKPPPPPPDEGHLF